ncbi:MAG: hypothetical protein ABJD68_10180 [Nakamurella sp.]
MTAAPLPTVLEPRSSGTPSLPAGYSPGTEARGAAAESAALQLGELSEQQEIERKCDVDAAVPFPIPLPLVELARAWVRQHDPLAAVHARRTTDRVVTDPLRDELKWIGFGLRGSR